MSLSTIKFSGTIECKTGLHIGGSKDNLKIGGIDTPVIKHPITDIPYIPGSSLKGKLRSLLEIKAGKPNICTCGVCDICKLFGSGDVNTKNSITRLLVRDAKISTKNTTDASVTEEKYENRIDRKTGITTKGSLRQIERVPEGTIFDFEIVLRVLTEEDNKLKETVKEALNLLMNDYLGGGGSRGYGQVLIQYKIE